MSTPSVEFVSLEEISLLKVSGEKSFDLLQGQLSCDVREVSASQNRLGVHCNPKGRVLATFRLLYKAPDYYLILPHVMTQFLMQDLRPYLPFYKVRLEDVTQQVKKIGVVGKENRSLCAALGIPVLQAQQSYSAGNNVYCAISGSNPRVMAFSLDGSVLEDVNHQIKSHLIWEAVEIDSGIANILPSTRGRFTPHQLYYPQKGGVSFSKGCYIGQEVIARLHYLGKSKQGLYQISFQGVDAYLPGMDITDQSGKPHGVLVNVATVSDTRHHFKGLAVIDHIVARDTLFMHQTPMDGICLTA